MQLASRPLASAGFSIVVAFVALAGACGGADPTPTSTAPAVAQASPTATATARPLVQVPTPTPLPPATPAVLTTLKTGSIAGIGLIVTDGGGRTLYVFDRDTPGQTGCTGGCLANWVPLIAIGSPVLEGVTGRVGAFKREGLGDQVTVNDKPLYRYIGDKATGVAEGQGAGGVWWVVAPDGFPLGRPVAQGQASPTVPAGPTALPTAAAPAPTPAGPKEALNISNFRLPSVVVEAGTTITWTNRDPDPHSVVHGTADTPGGKFDSPTLSVGESYSFKFDEPGTYDYVCGIHSSMTGRVLVNPSPSRGTPTPQPSASVAPGVPTSTATPAVLPTAPLPTATPTPVGLLENTTIAARQLPNIVAKAGATVEWTNLDNETHTVTHGSPGNIGGMFDSLNLTLGQKFKFQFVAPGTFDYFCRVHPTMRASVIVNP